MSENELNCETTDEDLLDELDVDGRPKSTAKEREQRRIYMAKYRKGKNDPQAKIEKLWAANLAALSEPERKRLEDAQEEARFLDWLMAKVDRGVSFCGQGIGLVDVDYPNPICVYEEVKAWIESGNTFVHSSFPRSMAGLFEADLQNLDDKEFILYGIKIHISFSIWHHFLENLFVWLMRNRENVDPELLAEVADVIEPGIREFAKEFELDEDIDYNPVGRALLEYRGKQSASVCGVQRTGLTLTLAEEIAQTEREIRKSVGVI
jgi:hypothetical protein